MFFYAHCTKIVQNPSLWKMTLDLYEVKKAIVQIVRHQLPILLSAV